MTDLDALLAAVCDRPDDDTPRLVYADHLDDGAVPDRPRRGDVVRLRNGAQGILMSDIDADGRADVDVRPR